MNTNDTLQFIQRIFSDRTTKTLPRRAVVTPEGVVTDKSNRPDLVEVEVLSQACESIRLANGEPVYPRDSLELFRLCINANPPAAWHCLYLDCKTSSVDWDKVLAWFHSDPNAAAGLVRNVVDTRDAAHLLGIVMVMGSVLPHMHEDALVAVRETLVHALRPFVMAFITHSRTVQAELRDTVLAALGRTLQHSRVPDAELVSLLKHCLESRNDDMLRLFLYIPIEHSLRLQPELLDGLLQVLQKRATRTAPGLRFPCLALMERVMRALPSEPSLPTVECIGTMVTATLDAVRVQGVVDARTTLAAAMLCQRCTSCSPMALTLAKALENSSAEIIRLQTLLNDSKIQK